MKKYLFIVLLVGVGFGQRDSLVLSSYLTYRLTVGCRYECPDELPRERYILSYNSNGEISSKRIEELWYPNYPDSSILIPVTEGRTLYDYQNGKIIDSTLQNYNSGFWSNQSRWTSISIDSIIFEYDLIYNDLFNSWDTVSIIEKHYKENNLIDYQLSLRNALTVFDSIKYHYDLDRLLYLEKFAMNYLLYPPEWGLSYKDTFQYDLDGSLIKKLHIYTPGWFWEENDADTLVTEYVWSGDVISIERTYDELNELAESSQNIFQNDGSLSSNYFWGSINGEFRYLQTNYLYSQELINEQLVYSSSEDLVVEQIPDSSYLKSKKIFSYDYLSNLTNDKEIRLSPQIFKVFQNYPNPFNPVTSLRYDLPEDGLINITIYDMMGRFGYDYEKELEKRELLLV